jgi:hypothetical protein
MEGSLIKKYVYSLYVQLHSTTGVVKYSTSALFSLHYFFYSTYPLQKQENCNQSGSLLFVILSERPYKTNKLFLAFSPVTNNLLNDDEDYWRYFLADDRFFRGRCS